MVKEAQILLEPDDGSAVGGGGDGTSGAGAGEERLRSHERGAQFGGASEVVRS